MKKSVLILIGIITTLDLTAQSHTYNVVFDQKMTVYGTLTDKNYLEGMTVKIRIVSSEIYRITFSMPGTNDPESFNVSYTTEYYDNGTLWFVYTDKTISKGKIQIASDIKFDTMATKGLPSRLILGSSNGFTHCYTLN
jgi:hypothetical protein